RDTGVQVSRFDSSVTDIDEWPKDNLILNSYSHDNADPDGEDADGFAIKLDAGYGNVLNGDISAYNADDGFDLYTKSDRGAIGPVTIKNCIAYRNGGTSDGGGTSNGDGNGFKLGGEDVAVDHIVVNNIAFQNP